MGYIDQKIQAALQRQKGSLLQEAQKAGASVLEVMEYGSEQPGAGSAVSSSLKAMVGGKLRVDNLQLYHLKTNDLDHDYMQPYSGLNPLPGEHHAILKGNLRVSIAFRKAPFGEGKWDTSGDKELEQSFKADRDLKKIANRFEWEWAIGMGTVKLDWTAQVCPLGNGTSHLVMKAGRYGGITTYEVGFSAFLALCEHLKKMLASAPNSAKQVFLIEPQYADLIYKTPSEQDTTQAQTDAQVGIQPSPATEKPAQTDAPVDYTDLIRSTLRPLEGKKVHVDQIPEKKERNVRQHVLPNSAREAKIIAVIDTTMMSGSAKDAIVFTPTHCYAKEMDDTAQFALADLKAVYGYTSWLEDKIDVEIEMLGRLTIPCSGQGTAAMEILKSIASHS